MLVEGEGGGEGGDVAMRGDEGGENETLTVEDLEVGPGLLRHKRIFSQ